jgi:hypothetical protein
MSGATRFASLSSSARSEQIESCGLDGEAAIRSASSAPIPPALMSISAPSGRRA